MNQYLKSLWLTETIRLIEKDNGRFQDDDANRQARAMDGNLAQRIIQRAQTISIQYGVKLAQIRWLRAAYTSLFLLVLLAFFSGAGIAFSALATNPVNLYWALVCLLGFHFLMLTIWLLSWIILPSESGSFFVYIWSWLTQKFTKKNTVTQLLPALISLFGGQIRWLIGMVVNLLWSVLLIMALFILIALLSTKHYSFEWQTTLLTTDTVVKITYLLGEIPSWLGFSIPDDAIIRTSDQAIAAAEARSAWAIWLLGVFIVYGVLVRFGLLIFCWIKWRVACRSIMLDIQLPEYQLLLPDLESYISKTIIDKEIVYANNQPTKIDNIPIQGQQNVLVAIEIAESWSIPNNTNFLGFMNTNEQQKQVLEHLQRYPAEKLLIAIDTDRSPERGITHLIKSLQGKSHYCRIWLINQGRQFHNWLDCIQSLQLEQANPTWLNN